ncbi:MAG TPA: DUF1223 domain-containing protein [Burkholderiaceae bacterium]|nr:DUF1223 domain-containing protein [Burkholderiaceae bacterium]
MRSQVRAQLSCVTLAAAVAAIAPTATTAQPRGCSAVSPAHQAVLVELYTSQGCSSCPPADRWLSGLDARRPRDRVVPIALHVNYWDHIGWKDPFARAEFTARQRELSAAGGSRTLYTPGVFVQGLEFPQWSASASFDDAIRALSAAPAAVRITLNAELAGTVVTVNAGAVALASARDPRLYLALVASGLATNVRAGENRGERLRNDRVVRAWSGPLPLTPGPMKWELPADGDAARYSIVGFVQVADGRVLQAVDLPLLGC